MEKSLGKNQEDARAMKRTLVEKEMEERRRSRRKLPSGRDLGRRLIS